jgi:hypothetical protein
MDTSELKIFNMLDDLHKQKYLDAPTDLPECRHYVLYEFLLNTIPSAMPRKEQLKYRKHLRSKMDECLKKVEAMVVAAN